MEPRLRVVFDRPFVSVLNSFSRPLVDLFIVFGLDKNKLGNIL